MKTLRITEIFYSLQGEATSSGYPTVFIRLTGCPLRCQYCDTAYAFSGGELLSLEAILAKVSSFPTRYVCVTGGEPLAQKPCLSLLTALVDRGYLVSLETSGAIPIQGVDPRVQVILDLKTPGSDEVSKNDFDNLAFLKPQDVIKFVICDEHDFRWASDIVSRYNLKGKCEIIFSPSFNQVQATQLAEWLLGSGLPARMQIQLHKYLWGDKPGV